MSDPDFVWLLETFQENHPGYSLVQETCLPIVLISCENPTAKLPLQPEEFMLDNPFEKLLLPEPDGEEHSEEK